MVLIIEKQREAIDIFTDTIANTTLFARSSSAKFIGRHQSRTDPIHTKGPPKGRGDSFSKGYGLRIDSKKPFSHYDHCNVDGHVRDTCFRLHGFPDWYKDYKAKTCAANMVDTPLHTNTPPQSFSNRIQDIAEPYPLITSGVGDITYFAQLDQFVGITSASLISTFSTPYPTDIGTWIVDIGASNLMCSTFSLLENPIPITSPIQVSLPNGSHALVKYTGPMHLNTTLSLKIFLYIPIFHYNLLYVAKLAYTSNITFQFYHNQCLLHTRGLRKLWLLSGSCIISFFWMLQDFCLLFLQLLVFLFVIMQI